MNEGPQYSRFPPLTPEQRERVHRRELIEFTPEQEVYWRRSVEEAERERPQVAEQFRRIETAAKEQTVSGAIRRAVPRCGIDLAALAFKAGVSMDLFGDFLEGMAPLPSDAIDRLAQVMGVKVTDAVPEHAAR